MSAEGLTGALEVLVDPEGVVVAARAEGAWPGEAEGLVGAGLEAAIGAEDAAAAAAALAASGQVTLAVTIGGVAAVAELRRLGDYVVVAASPRAEGAEAVTGERLAQHRLEEIGILSSGIAHDFNNILSAILGNAELLAELLPGLVGEGDADLLAAVSDVITAAQRSRELIGQMLGYAVKAQARRGLCDLSAVAAEMGRLLRVSTPSSVVFDLDLAARLPLVAGDASQLRQVIMNLIVNAADAIGDQVGSIAVRTSSRFVERASLEGSIGGAGLAEGDYVVVEVADSGCGMDAATAARIFDPFFTTKSKGHGLGLAGVRAIVAAHGGALTVESAVGLGTTMRVLLPVAAEAAEAASASAAAEAASLAGRTVLVIDDEAMVREATRRILEARGARVISASDGYAGIELFLAEPGIECVLLDVSMPYIHGLDVFRELARIRPAPVVLISGYSGEEIQRRAAGVGVAGFLHKPFSAAELVAAVRAAIG